MFGLSVRNLSCTCPVLVPSLSCPEIQVRLYAPLWRGMDVKVAVPQVPMFAEEQVAEEALKIDRRIVDAFHKILIVCPRQRIAEIPGMVCEKVIVDVEAYGAEVLNGKDGGGARVSFAECVDLPNP